MKIFLSVYSVLLCCQIAPSADPVILQEILPEQFGSVADAQPGEKNGLLAAEISPGGNSEELRNEQSISGA